MKPTTTPRFFPGLILGLGLLGSLLYRFVFQTAVDEKGLVVENHPLVIALWVLTALAGVLVLLLSGEEETTPDLYRHTEKWSEFLGAAAIALSLPGSLAAARSVLDGLHLGLSVLACAGLATAGIFRLREKQAPFWCYAGSTLFFALHVVVRYRVLSAQPQLVSFLHPVLGALALLCFTYLRAVPGKYRLRRWVGYFGSFVCLVAFAGQTDPMLYLLGSLWMGLTAHIPGEAL